MSRSIWRWLRRTCAGPSRRGHQGQPGKRRQTPRLELLEARDVPAVVQPNYLVFATPDWNGGASAATLNQIKNWYGFNQISFNNGTVAGDGSGTTIAIVDAFDNPGFVNSNAANFASSYLHLFDVQFGLTDPVFTKVNQNGGSTMPAADNGWSGEIALDVEWSHAIAPKANILLVEANGSDDADLLAAVDYARRQAGVASVSMSWGEGEFSGETNYDSHFQTPAGHTGVTFVASAGDSGAPPIWPSISANVLSVGGTTLNLDGVGNIASETSWSGSGGGLSTVVSQPAYQQGLTIHNGSNVISANGHRASPDVSYDANPGTGFPVYNGSWLQYGGTSAGSPQWAALIAIADQGRALVGLGSLDGPSQTLPLLYSVSAGDFHDVTAGGSTGSPNYSAGPGYDLVTGVGTPVANRLVGDLMGYGVALSSVADQTVVAGKSVSVTLSASGPAGVTLTYSAVADSQEYVLRQRYGLFYTGNYWLNWGGKNEKWLYGSGGQEFFILANGQFYLWDRSGTASGTLLASFSSADYADPSLIYNAKAGQGQAALSLSGNVLTITPNAGFTGVFTVTATASDGQATDSKAFNVTVSGNANQPPVLSAIPNQTVAAGGSVSVTLSATDPDGDALTYSAVADSQEYALKQQYGLYYTGSYWLNWGGKNEKWLYGNNGQEFFILANGQFYLWDRSGTASGTLLASFSSADYADPSLIYNAKAGQGQAALSLSGNVLTITPNAGFTGIFTVTATASDGQATDSKAFNVTVSGSANQPPVLSAIPNQTVAAGGSVSVTLSATDPDGDALTYSAVADSQEYALKQQYGLYYTGSYWLNWGGKNEKWLYGNNGQEFFILANGQFYLWDRSGTASGTLLASFSSADYADPSLIYNAKAGQGQAALSLSGNVLTITPNAGFTGVFTVTATASDGQATDSKAFSVTVS